MCYIKLRIAILMALCVAAQMRRDSLAASVASSPTSSCAGATNLDGPASSSSRLRSAHDVPQQSPFKMPAAPPRAGSSIGSTSTAKSVGARFTAVMHPSMPPVIFDARASTSKRKHSSSDSDEDLPLRVLKDKRSRKSSAWAHLTYHPYNRFFIMHCRTKNPRE
jgi:hypothetical protein